MCTEAFGKPLGGIERDVIQCVQFEDDHGFDQLIHAEGATWPLIDVRVVDLVDGIPAEKNVHCRWSAESILFGNGLQPFADQCTLVARARNSIECNVEYQKVILQGQFRQCPKMPLR